MRLGGTVLPASALWSGIYRVKAPSILTISLIALSSSLHTPAYSQEAADAAGSQAGNTNEWILTLGGSVEYGPSYPGSKHLSVSAMPSFDIRRFGEPAGYSTPDDNIDFGLVDLDGIEIGPVVGFRDGRSASDDQRLHGLARIDWGLDAGAFAQFWAVQSRLRLRGEVRQSLRAGNGLVGDISLDWFQPVGDNLVVSVGPRISLANDAFMRRYFGISQKEAADNGALPSFDAHGGAKSLGIMVAATFTLSPSWSLQVYDRYDRLIADSAKSPITSDIGSKNQNIIGVAFNHSFQIAF
jgi:outer membrane protein